MTGLGIREAQAMFADDPQRFERWVVTELGGHPAEGTDTVGVDGLVGITGDDGHPRRALVAVKGGERVPSRVVRDLAAVLAETHSDLAILVTMAKPSADLLSAAAAVGESENHSAGSASALVQVLSVAQLLDRGTPAEP